MPSRAVSMRTRAAQALRAQGAEHFARRGRQHRVEKDEIEGPELAREKPSSPVWAMATSYCSPSRPCRSACATFGSSSITNTRTAKALDPEANRSTRGSV